MGILKSIARVAGRQVMGRLFEAGYSGSKALAFLKSTTGGYRKKDFYADWREITGIKKLKNTYKYIPRKYALSYNLMAATSTKQGKEFKYLFTTKNRDVFSGNIKEGTVSMISDTRMSIDDAEELMGDQVTLLDEQYLKDHGFQIESIQLTAVLRKNPNN